ncbi:hypothetical protein JKA74_16280 [Marivirga sp. S37H4]|uniref:Uncharacterized protein n=1 Tax=Marivirga aurantiaca TaxID=2802615 RepID=A0A935CAL1_9BACT|nr:hypothetical protein [Marivirga aurantiaca]MBK6266604.1 hypothetical protein [Marivirga aurantiaca]
MTSIDKLYSEYTKERNIKLNKEQFVYIVNLFPALRVVLSDGIVDKDEWITVKRLAKILGDEFATEDLGEEKEENLMLIYKAEFRYLIKNLGMWESKFLKALKEYFEENESSKEFVLETMYLFAHASDGVSEEEDNAIDYLTSELGLDNTVI